MYFCIQKTTFNGFSKFIFAAIMKLENKKFTVKSRINSFVYAINGIIHTFRQEKNILIQSIFAVASIIAGIIFKISPMEWIAIVLCIGMVFACEIINTAIETIVDFISPEHHKKAGLIKDLAAGAVLVMSIASAIVAAIIFIPKLISNLL